MIVVDAAVLIKLFKLESDSADAKILIETALRQAVPLIAPTIAFYESLSAALHIEHPLSAVHDLFDRLSAVGLSTVTPTSEDIALAERIARTPSPGGGYPALFDSIYHAIAIRLGGTFVSADIKHIARSSGFGSILSLADWVRTNATPPRF